MQSKRMYKNYIGVLLAFLLVFVLISGWRVLPAFAKTSSEGSVLNDFLQDEDFSMGDYPINDEDGTLRVIQIAEGTRAELFVYTYQPYYVSKPLVASEINMSLSESVDGTKLYKLRLLSSYSTLCKYVVEDFTVSDERDRYYNITSIYRSWDKELDGDTGNDNTINYKAFAVGKLFEATTEADGSVMYNTVDIDVIEIKNPYVDFLRYSDGVHWDFLHTNYSTDVHYIAFDTNMTIDYLKEADVSFITQSYHQVVRGGKTVENKKGEPSDTQYLTLTQKYEVSNAADGFRAKKYTWTSIQSSENFIANSDLTDTAKAEVEKTKWVLIFLGTKYTYTKIETMFEGIEYRYDGTNVSEVTILRLEFWSRLRLYNLGVVSDKVTGDDKPGNNDTNETLSLFDWLEQQTGVSASVWKALLILIIVAIVVSILSALFPPVAQIVLWLLKALWWLISAPFKGIAALIEKAKDKS